jgi:HAD superfamily hydrolase (TIGR01509 family)
MNYKAIIFDFFDVIHYDPFQRWLKARGLTREGPMQEASVEMDKGLIDAPEFLRRVSAECGSTPEQIQKEFDEYHKFDQEMVVVVKALAKEYQIGLLCNGPTTFVRGLLKDGGIEDTFHHIVISSEVGMVKPDPNIFLHILKKMDVKPEESIFIDDNPKNVAAANALGIHGIQYTGLPQLRYTLKELRIKLP